MLLTIDTSVDDRDKARSAIGFLIHLYNLDSETIEALVNNEDPPKSPTGSSIPTAAAGSHLTGLVPPTATAAVTPATDHPMHLDIRGNVVNFPVPPPPPAVFDSSAGTAASVQANPLANVTSAAAVTDVASVSSAPIAALGSSVTMGVAPVEYDDSGMPWDIRIHQRGRSKKKDGTWKLQKGIDPAIVQAVTIELAARKIATPKSPTLPPTIVHTASGPTLPPPPPSGPVATGAVPPPPPVAAPVPLPPTDPASGANVGGGNSVPVPALQGSSPPTQVPPPSVAPSVPVPPVSPTGLMGAITYRSIIDKMTLGTREKTLTAAKVLEIVQSCGCPNLQQLNQLPQIFEDVNSKIDLALLGLL